MLDRQAKIVSVMAKDTPATIVATATAAGKSAIGIVRMSGPKSLQIKLQLSSKDNFVYG